MTYKLELDELLMEGLIVGSIEGLAMTGITPKPVGVTRLYSGMSDLSVMVGLVGKSSGMLSINATESGVSHIVSAFLGEDSSELDEDCLDAFMELGNIIAGSVKLALNHTIHQVDQISLPSLVFGANYSVYYSRGIDSVTVQFELPGVPVHRHRDRFFSTSISLMRGSGA